MGQARKEQACLCGDGLERLSRAGPLEEEESGGIENKKWIIKDFGKKGNQN